MTKAAAPRMNHLRRLTDSRGLIKSALGECPDRFAGYDSLDNTDALRLCALASDTVQGETLDQLAKTYFAFLNRARGADGRIRHACDHLGQWNETGNDAIVQSRLARALAAVIVSELPISLRLAAADWWKVLIANAAGQVRTPVAAGNWLLAISQLRSADPGRDSRLVGRLAAWLVEDCHHSVRSSDWEWFEPRWVPGAAAIPAGLWSASELLQDRSIESVAEVTTRFVIDHLFEDGLFLPVGTIGGWSRNTGKALFNQLPAEAAAMVELLRIAEDVSGSGYYGQYADFACRWFGGNNVRGQGLITPEGGCLGGLTADGLDANCTASAAVSYLLAEATMASRTAIVEETTVYTVPARR